MIFSDILCLMLIRKMYLSIGGIARMFSHI
ncbi:hypothetical protein LCGC14_2405130, partial [marine sediment metagenome]